jgi:hypothetical protein
MIPPPHEPQCIVFQGARRIAAGSLREVWAAARTALESSDPEPVLVFDDVTGEVIDLDLREAPAETAAGAGRGPGRPRLGVVAREVTLLPRHWEWLSGQPGGASVVLRKLVEEARRAKQDRDRVRLARERAYRFLSAMAGNEAGFEEAARALFAGEARRFEALTESWPRDVREQAMQMAARAFHGEKAE